MVYVFGERNIDDKSLKDKDFLVILKHKSYVVFGDGEFVRLCFLGFIFFIAFNELLFF